jgi:GntR family transcriptional regulator, arabinose operon transcriptional repressor
LIIQNRTSLINDAIGGRHPSGKPEINQQKPFEEGTGYLHALDLTGLMLYYQLVTITNDLLGSKYQRIYRTLKDLIASGEYKTGQRLPSESELVKTFGASRITVNRALRELQLGGIINRRAGSGSYVNADTAPSYTFGLLIPELGQTEIFEPICQGMMAERCTSNHVLIWGKSLGSSDTTEAEAKGVCQRLISSRVSGVFFAPLEANSHKDEINSAIAAMLTEAGIAVVMLDRDIVDYPRRSRYDVVGIDNRRAGYIATEHLIETGCRRIGFIGRPHLAPSCVARYNGYRDAVACSSVQLAPEFAERLDPSDKASVSEILERYQPDGIVCSNDRTAAVLMRTLAELRVPIPDKIRLVAFDDVKYASLVSVPLTTIHQPCDHLGAAAIQAMIQRIESPDIPARDVLVDFHLVVRESCGAQRFREAQLTGAKVE